MRRRTFIRSAIGGLAAAAVGTRARAATRKPSRPNLVYVFADQWRAQATGYAGDPNVRTPNLDRLAGECVNVRNAISGWPVCSPYRGSLITGQYPHTHGIFVNDVPLGDTGVSFGEALKGAGYATGYIGKWHLDGRGRSSYIPQERRQGFDFWRVLECTHDYNQSSYYADNDTKRVWDGYDAFAQTREAQGVIREQAKAGPFALFLSWGPPHNPYETAPAEYRAMYSPDKLALRPNVPREAEAWARTDLAGYYAHCTALDDCVRDLLKTLEDSGVADDTVFVFTSDHGDMLGSHGEMRKQRPWDESNRVPFLLRYPRRFGSRARSCGAMLNSPDIMPTLLSLCDIPIPSSVEGRDLSPALTRRKADDDDAALLACYAPFGEWTREKGGREYRGIRTPRYTYVRDLRGPWLLFDNEKDPYQQHNLCDSETALRERLDSQLMRKLKEAADEFLPAEAYLAKWGYKTDPSGTVPYKP
ncbi:MAG: sulfatase [Candidatus Hydrogenedentales bacterium]